MNFLTAQPSAQIMMTDALASCMLRFIEAFPYTSLFLNSITTTYLMFQLLILLIYFEHLSLRAPNASITCAGLERTELQNSILTSRSARDVRFTPEPLRQVNALLGQNTNYYKIN